MTLGSSQEPQIGRIGVWPGKSELEVRQKTAPMQSFDQKTLDLAGSQRSRKKIALPVFAAKQCQLVKLPNDLDAFGHDAQVERLCEIDDRPNDLAVFIA